MEVPQEKWDFPWLLKGLDRCVLSWLSEPYASPLEHVALFRPCPCVVLGIDVGIPSCLNAYTIRTRKLL